MSRLTGFHWQVVLLMALGGTLVGCKSGGGDGSASRKQEYPATSVASGGAAARADAPGTASAAPASNAKEPTSGAGTARGSAASASGGATGLAADAATTARAAAEDALPLDFDLVEKAFQVRRLGRSWLGSHFRIDAQEFLALYAADATWTVEAAAGGQPKTERVVEVAQARLKGDEGRPSKAWSWQAIEQTAAPRSGFTLSTALCFRKSGESLGCRLVKLEVAPDAQGALRIQHEHWQSLVPEEQLPTPILTLSSRLLQLTLLKVPCALDLRVPRRAWEYCEMAVFVTANGLRIMSGLGGFYPATDPHDQFLRGDDHTLTWLSTGSEKRRLHIRRSGSRIVFESQFIDLETPSPIKEPKLEMEVRLPRSQPVPIYCATTEERVQHRCLPEVSGI